MEKTNLETPGFITTYYYEGDEVFCSVRLPKPLELKRYLKTIGWKEIKVKDFRSFWKKGEEEIYLDFSAIETYIEDETLELLQFIEEKTWEDLRKDIFAVVLDDYEQYLTSEIPELRLIAKAAKKLRD